MIDEGRLREALERLDKQRAAGSTPVAVDFATVVEDGPLDLICAAARLVLEAGAAEGEVEAAVDAFVADRENARLPTYISKPSWRNHIQAVLTAAALWRKEHGERVPVDKVERRPFVYDEQPKLVETETARGIEWAFRKGAEAMREQCAQRTQAWRGGNLGESTWEEAIRSLPLPTPKGEKT